MFSLKDLIRIKDNYYITDKNVTGKAYIHAGGKKLWLFGVYRYAEGKKLRLFRVYIARRSRKLKICTMLLITNFFISAAVFLF